MTRPIILFAILLTNLVYSQSSHKLDDIKKIYSSLGVEKGPAYAGAIIKGDNILHLDAFGRNNIVEGSKSSLKSTFQIGNLAQQVVVLGILILERDGSLSREEYITQYLPLDDAFDNIKIKHLINHTSGLNDVNVLKRIVGYEQTDVFTAQDAIRIVKSQERLNQQPGKGFSSTRSKSEIILMTYLIERITGKTLDEFARKNIFQPLKMEATYFNEELDYKYDVVTAYTKTEDSYRTISQAPKTVSPFNLRSSISDLAKWYASFYTSSPSELQRLIQQLDTPVILENGETLKSANGEMTIGREFSHLERGVLKYWTYSLTNGFGANVFRFPHQKMISIGLTSDNTYAGRLAMSAIKPLMKEHYTLPQTIDFEKIKDKPLKIKDRKEIEGNYWDYKNAYGTRISTANDTLFYGYLGDDYKIALKHLGNLKFQQITNSGEEVFVQFEKEKGTMKLKEFYSDSAPITYAKFDFNKETKNPNHDKFMGYYINKALNIVLEVSSKNGAIKLCSSKLSGLELIPVHDSLFRTEAPEFRSIEFKLKGNEMLLIINTTGIQSLEFKKLRQNENF